METSNISVEQLQARVDGLRSRRCSNCGGKICGHEILFSIAMGQADQPRCVDCLAQGLGKSTGQMRDHLLEHFRHRDCYGEVWRRENEREGFDASPPPLCLWSNETAEMVDDPFQQSPNTNNVPPVDGTDDFEAADDVWDAGDMACGDLVLALRIRMNALSPGSRLQLTARDPGAKEDIPAWSRMTGHTLLAEHHPHYLIQRKE